MSSRAWCSCGVTVETPGRVWCTPTWCLRRRLVASRTVARDKVTSFVRDPFVEGEAYDGEDERPVRDTELRQAIGELVTCTRCIGTWIGAALASTQILAPRTGRLLTSVLAAGALNDFLLAGFNAVTSKANELEDRVES